ncbi:hypothetical protein Tco_1540054 [Tanacetum coccineum]
MGEPTIEEYMTKTRDGYVSGIARPKIDEKAQFEFKGQFLKELRDNTFSGSDHEDANEHIKKVLEIVDVFHISNITQDQEVILCYKGLEVPTRQILDSKGAIPTMTTVDARCMTRSSTKELLSLFENPKQKFRSNRRLFNTPSLVESNSPKFEHNFDIKEQSEEEVREIMTETIEQYMSKTRENYGSGVTRPTINQDTPFELKGQLLKELRDNTFNGSEHKDANEHIEKEVILFYNGLDVPTRQILDLKGVIPSKTTVDAKVAIQEMAEYSQKWHNGTSSRTKSTETYDGHAAIQAQLNSLKQEIKKEEGKTLEEAYYTQFSAPYQPGGQYRAAGPGFYQQNSGNSLYPDQRPSLEESLTKFMTESSKRHEENSNIIKEI